MEIKLNNGVKIGDNHPTFIIAEIGNNHNGDMNIAKKLVDEAARAGASAVKFQTKDVETAFDQNLLDKPYTGCNSFGATYREHKNALEFDIAQHKSYHILFFINCKLVNGKNYDGYADLCS